MESARTGLLREAGRKDHAELGYATSSLLLRSGRRRRARRHHERHDEERAERTTCPHGPPFGREQTRRRSELPKRDTKAAPALVLSPRRRLECHRRLSHAAARGPWRRELTNARF